MWKVLIWLSVVSSALGVPLELVQYAYSPYQHYQRVPQTYQVVSAVPNSGVVQPQNIVLLTNAYPSNPGNPRDGIIDNIYNWFSPKPELPVEEAEGDTEPITQAPPAPSPPAAAAGEESKPPPENEKLEEVEPLPVQPIQPQGPSIGVVPASTTRLIIGQPQFFGNYGALQQGSLVLRQQPFPVVPFGVSGVPYQPGRPPFVNTNDVETLPLTGKFKSVPSRFSQYLHRFQPVKRKQANEENDEEQADEVQSEPEVGPTIAQSKPAAIALAGPGGTASAGPLGQALVGPGGIAISAPSATAVSGGARPPPIAPPQAAQAYKTFYTAMNKPESLIKTFGQ